ncbi:septum site-determining protein MinC [Tumebacillus permanentifrigoris]|uniref:Probable septum site-determining protein MinC n=1 Tax=Tumebacillus permanentifrigoris TaxID=378543 RepID=A0A316D3M6_9BACL|nr:septum site-determining protein MinC [Tumebacillus permanentifrigoris]PWK06268.1 septum site-determining protein MinC [Tumebacillus permanentifrigoris]
MGHQAGCELNRTRTPVTIKGIRDGLVFILHDQCSFEEIVEDLEDKLNGSHRQLLTGPLVHVTIQSGSRQLTEQEQEKIRVTLASHGNLIIQEFQSTADLLAKTKVVHPPHLYHGMVRSGQIVEHEGDIVIIGDVNPGGQVHASGDIFVMGTLRGLAHAGCRGNERAIIAAVFFQPTQLRICDVISRSPDLTREQQREMSATEMEFAYLRDGQMAVDKMNHLYSIRARED